VFQQVKLLSTTFQGLRACIFKTLAKARRQLIIQLTKTLNGLIVRIINANLAGKVHKTLKRATKL